MKYRGLTYNREKESYEWVYGLPSYGYATDEVAEIGTVYGDFKEIFPDTLGEQTPYRDKNGKEIYTGDIVALEVDGQIREFVVDKATVDREYNTLPNFEGDTVKVRLDTGENTLRELQSLIAKEKDLEKRIKELNTDTTGNLYTDKVVEMRTPGKEGEDADPYGAYNEDGKEKTQGPALSVAMETTIKSSAFERAMKLEDQLNKVHGRIIKLLDTIKSYELEQRRIALEEKRYALMKQKISGEYDVDPDTGEIDDSYTEDSEDGEV